MFADDTTVLIACNNTNEAELIANETLNSLMQEFANHNLLLNPSKTNLIHFHSNRYDPNSFFPTITLDETVLDEVSDTNFLGVRIDEILNYKPQIEELSMKLNKALYVLRRISLTCNLESALTVYHSLFLSHINYSIILWGSNQGHLQHIFKIQKRAIRFMLGLTMRTSCKEHFIALKLLTVPSIYIKKTIEHVKKIESDLPHTGDVHSYDTRHRNTLAHIQHRTAAFEKSVKFQGTKLIRKLPNNILSLNELKAFKKSLNEYLVTNSFYSVEEFLQNQ